MRRFREPGENITVVSPLLKEEQVLGDRLSTDPAGADLSRTLGELGLALEAKVSPMTFVVIDSIERPSND